MSDTERIVNRLRELAGENSSATEIAIWLRDELGPETTFFRFAGCLFQAFAIGVEKLRPLEQWTGFGPGGSLPNDELERLLGPLIPRTGNVAE